MTASHLSPLDPSKVEDAINSAAIAYRNWGRWGEDDVLGTLNFIDEAKRREAARLVTRGVTFSLAQAFDGDGPQNGWRRRTNPIHTMLDTGLDAEAGTQGFPHGFAVLLFDRVPLRPSRPDKFSEQAELAFRFFDGFSHALKN